MTLRLLPARAWFAIAALGLPRCGDDDAASTEADGLLVGAECRTDEDCADKGSVTTRCLLEFKGGYCGVTDCERNSECPKGAACVAQQGKSYCFRGCSSQAECNANRRKENEASCSSGVEYLSGQKEGKACVPSGN